MQEAGYDPAPTEANRGSQYGAILSIRAVYFLAAFVLIYVGTEVTLGGWIVTFIIRERAGGPSSGYISSGVLRSFDCIGFDLLIQGKTTTTCT